jgi:hypothetical protein
MSKRDPVLALVEINGLGRSCLAKMLFALSVSKERSINNSRSSSFLAQGDIRDVGGGFC